MIQQKQWHGEGKITSLKWMEEIRKVDNEKVGKKETNGKKKQKQEEEEEARGEMIKEVEGLVKELCKEDNDE